MQDRPDKKDASLYDTDFFVWCHEQARLVRERRFGELDLDNVAEELESTGRSDKHQIRSRLRVLIAHLVKWKYQPGARKPGWRSTIREQRTRIAELIADSPSLKAFPASIAIDCYEAARLAAAEETGIDYTLFPEVCPFTAEQILDPDFLPKEPDLYDQS
ncbi:MAG: DUF29 domain-containing protein [Hyphomicrobiaceae bacterium]